ncbi:MAG: hypothetical protein NVSMB21_20780 [Vulcanimicrobiaceae bacterium]
MNRIVKGIATVAGAFAVATVATAASAADRLADGAVTIRASGATVDGIGSGTIVAKNGTTIRVLTAKHVATFGALTIRFEDGTRVPAHVSSAVPDRDLAIVEADVPASLAAELHAVTVAEPRSQDSIHVWGSGLNGPAFEPGAVARVGGDLPDGAAHGRYALACALCHEGDSGGGVFDLQGRLVGVYIGYFETGSTRVSVAESPFEAARVANSMPFPTTVAGTFER